jgi:tight adherence protein C
MEFFILILPAIILALGLLLLREKSVDPDRINSIVLENFVVSKPLNPKVRSKVSSTSSFYRKIRDQNAVSSLKIQKLLLKAGVRGENAVEIFRVARFAAAFSLGGLVWIVLTFAEKFDVTQPLKTIIILAAGTFGFFLPTILMINNAMKRRDEIRSGIPDMLDLMVICIQGGLSLEPALTRVSKEIRESHKILSEEMTTLNVELSYLGDRFKAYQNLQERIDLPEIKSLASMMYQSEKLGTPLAVAFNTLTDETRKERMSVAERKAGALGSKLTVPMIAFFVPAMFVVILGPAIIQMTSM